MNTNILINAVRKLETRKVLGTLTPKEERQFGAFFDEAMSRLQKPAEAEIFGSQKTIGKHKLPRFMYHITTEDNFKSILKDGCIKPSKCADFSSDGIFLFDMKNFTRFWRRTKDIVEQPRTTLLNMLSSLFKDKTDLVLLKIPTESLDARTMRLRRQKLCRCGVGGLNKSINELYSDTNHMFSKILKEMQYVMHGENISKLPLYNRRKEAVEYIVPDAISADKIEFVGKVSADTRKIGQAASEMKELQDIWLQLTKGKPEQKAFEHMVKD